MSILSMIMGMMVIMMMMMMMMVKIVQEIVDNTCVLGSDGKLYKKKW